MKSRKLLSGPYLFWAASFIIIPLLMILYYGLTDKNGNFTLMNLAQITTQENLKALGLALLLSFVSTLICLILAYPLAMILSEKNVNQTSFIVLIFILPMWMNFLLRTLAWQNLLEKKRCHQYGSALFPSSGACADQHTVCDHSRHGIQFPAVYGAADLQCTFQDRPGRHICSPGSGSKQPADFFEDHPAFERTGHYQRNHHGLCTITDHICHFRPAWRQ